MSFFSGYPLSDDELKNSIFQSVIEFLIETQELSNESITQDLAPSLPNELFLKNILQYVPMMEHAMRGSNRLNENEQLKLMAVNVDTFICIHKFYKELRNIQGIFYSKPLFGLQYSLATLYIEKVLGEKLNDNPKDINLRLFDFVNNSIDVDLYEKITKAEDEILRVINNPNVSDTFSQLSTNHINQINSYVVQQLDNRVREVIIFLFMEAVNKFLPDLSFNLGVSEENTKKVLKYFKAVISEQNHRLFRERHKDLRGGNAKKGKFTWTPAQIKIDFYLKVESLDRVNEKPIWDYAFEEFTSKNHNLRIKDYLIKDTPLKDAPKELVNQAFVRWKRYKKHPTKNSDDHPFAFQLRHASELLNYPPETKYLTMKRYYAQGKKLFESNKLHNT